MVKLPIFMVKLLIFMVKLPTFMVKLLIFMVKLPIFMVKLPTFMVKLPIFMVKFPTFMVKLPIFMVKLPTFMVKTPFVTVKNLIENTKFPIKIVNILHTATFGTIADVFRCVHDVSERELSGRVATISMRLPCTYDYDIHYKIRYSIIFIFFNRVYVDLFSQVTSVPPVVTLKS